MTAVTRATLKTYYQTGDFPSAGNFADLIDSCANLTDTAAQVFHSSIFAPAVSATLMEAGTVSAQTGNFTTLNVTNGIPLPQIPGNTVLVNNTAVSAAPSSLSLTASTILGRGASGNISALAFNGFNSVIGMARNVKMSVTSASATATISADEVVVGTALGGAKTLLPSFSQSINLGTTGIGGMDTSTAPASGFVALYAAWNGTTQGVFACNTSTSTTSVYSGANAPSGYTQTALIGLWPTNGSRQFIIGYQIDRAVFFAMTTVGSGLTSASYASLSIASFIPPSAKTVLISATQTGSGNNTFLVASDASGTGALPGTFFAASYQITLGYVAMITAQTIYYQIGNSAAVSIFASGYTF